ncbi:uncharacterized protein LOC110882390 [Helianthus annuus]|uniref:uncharacterized protein LOC110882390 n=1 Tax=Helianthus annuus TaxID=4232 RepID=UPI000B90536D|nr:uncharacterized protein LOC110882390 [Helianthus annuus]
MAAPIHPAMTISNIKNFIPITLEVETDHYSTWSELFQNCCKAYQVFDHLQPRPTAATSSTTADKAADQTADKAAEAAAEALWSRLDAIVKQWIYGTISTDLLHIILSPGQTAHQAWTTLENIFKDNKNSRAVYLQQEFTNVRLDNYPNMAAYL